MADPLLDLPTLMVATAMVIAFAGALLMLARRTGRPIDVALIWGASMVTGALGFLVTAVAQRTAAIQGGLGTTVFLAAVALSWVGARTFSGRPPSLRLAAAGPVGWLLTVPLQVRSPPGLAGPFLALACLIGVAYTLGIANELRQSRAQVLPSRPIALTLLLVHAVIYLVRAAFALFGLPHDLWSRDLLGLLTLESLLHTVGMAFLMLALLKERAEFQATEQLRRLSLQDGLTGIANRRQFDDRLLQEVRRAARAAEPIALLMMDVDRFKALNDTLGHQQGDECLKTIATRLQTGAMRSTDLLARYGGEEFVLLMPNTALDGAMAVAHTLRSRIEAIGLAFPLGPGGAPTPVTISIGAAVLVPQSTERSGHLLVRYADEALYEAKKGGRNTVRAAGPSRPRTLEP